MAEITDFGNLIFFSLPFSEGKAKRGFLLIAPFRRPRKIDVRRKSPRVKSGAFSFGKKIAPPPIEGRAEVVLEAYRLLYPQNVHRIDSLKILKEIAGGGQIHSDHKTGCGNIPFGVDPDHSPGSPLKRRSSGITKAKGGPVSGNKVKIGKPNHPADALAQDPIIATTPAGLSAAKTSQIDKLKRSNRTPYGSWGDIDWSGQEAQSDVVVTSREKGASGYSRPMNHPIGAKRYNLPVVCAVGCRDDDSRPHDGSSASRAGCQVNDSYHLGDIDRVSIDQVQIAGGFWRPAGEK
jgi:hypothetical protein